MIYLFVALHAEASPLIRHYQLKKDGTQRFDEFYNEEKGVRLILTGVGNLATAVSVSNICTKYAVGEKDFLVNIGTCAGLSGRGEMFLCNKIIDRLSGRTFYPDILYRHSLPEISVMTGATLTEYSAMKENILYDMEATAIYQAGAYFLGPHQMSFIKIISDAGYASAVSKEQIGILIESKLPEIIKFLDTLQKAGELQQKDIVRFEEEVWLDKLCDDLCCSQTMRASVLQYFRYLLLQGVDCKNIVQKMYTANLLPCRDRREGKKRFEELKAGLL